MATAERARQITGTIRFRHFILHLRAGGRDTLLARLCCLATRGARLDSAVQPEARTGQEAGTSSPRTEQRCGSGIPPGNLSSGEERRIEHCRDSKLDKESGQRLGSTFSLPEKRRPPRAGELQPVAYDIFDVPASECGQAF